MTTFENQNDVNRFNAGIVLSGVTLTELEKILNFIKFNSEAKVPYIKKSIFKIILSEAVAGEEDR